METSFLREFLVLEETNNFSKAARILHTTQATLSRHIKQFEEEYDVLLFERTTQKMKLTPYGQSLYRYANEILAQEHEFQLEAEKIRYQHSTHLVIGTIGFPYYYGITAFLGEFKTQHPNATLEVIVASTDELLDMLRTGKVQVAFIRNLENVTDNYNSVKFAEDYVRLAVPMNHMLSDLETVHIGLLKNDLFYKRVKKGSLMDRFQNSIFEEAGFTPKFSDSETTWEDSVINDAHAVTFCLGGLAQTFRGNVHVKVLTLQPQIHADIYLAAPADALLSETAESFMEFARTRDQRSEI